MIEVFLWAETREILVSGLLSISLPGGEKPFLHDPETGGLSGIHGIYIDEIGTLVKREAVLGRHGVIETPAEVSPGYHANVLIEGEVERILTDGLPQHDADDALLPLFQRTRLLQLIQNMAESRVSFAGEPEGYAGIIGVKMFDPALVTNRRREWFLVE